MTSVDMWALGVVTYMLLSGKRPFHHQNKREKARRIRQDPLRFPSPEWDRVSQEAKGFCAALMQKQPRDRLSATAAVAHPWIKNESKLHAGDDAAHELAKEAHSSIIDSLETFCEADDLKKLALEVIAFSTPPAKLAELREIFVKIDVNNTGTISMREFKDAMALHPVPQLIEQMFRDMDMDSSGQVDYSEPYRDPICLRHSNASILQPSHDADGDGYITKADLPRPRRADGRTQDARHATARRLVRRVTYQVFKNKLLHGLQRVQKPADGFGGCIHHATNGA